MGFVHCPWARNARCVLVMATDITAFHMSTEWLSMLGMGFLHRDISIGNVLMLKLPVEAEQFEERTVEKRMEQLHLQDMTPELTKYVNLVEKMVKEMDSPNQCRGFVTDGDIAARLEDHFTSCDTGERSVGTPNCVGEPNRCDFHTGNIRVHVPALVEHSLGLTSPFPFSR